MIPARAGANTASNTSHSPLQISIEPADNSTAPSLSEPEPENFSVDPKFKPNGLVLFSQKVLISMIDTISILAGRPFDEKHPDWDFPEPANALRFIMTSSKDPASPGFQSKSMMWSLRRVANWFKDQDRYAEVGFTTKYTDGPFLGFGQILSTAPPSPPVEDSAYERRGASPNEDQYYVDTFRSVALEPVFDFVAVYAMVISLIIQVADEKFDKPVRSVFGYDPVADFTFYITPTSSKADPLPYKAAVLSLADAARKLAYVDPVYRWKPVAWLIRAGGPIIGRGALLKGQVEPPALEGLEEQGPIINVGSVA